MSGDADLAVRAGEPCSEERDERSTETALVFRAGGVDYRKFFSEARSNPAIFGKVGGGLKALLGHQILPLPRHPKTDPYLTELCEEFDYGHYTRLSKIAMENPEEFLKHRQHG